MVYAYGCQPKCRSLLNPKTTVSAIELQGEIAQLQARIESRQLSLQQQEELRDILFSAALTAAQSGTINPFGIATTLAAVIGIGAGAEGQLQKRKLKKKLAEKNKDDSPDPNKLA